MMTDDGRRIRELIRGNDDKVLDRWVAAAADPLQGQVTPAELQGSFAELLSSLSDALEEAGDDVRADAYAERAGGAGRDVPRPRPPRVHPERDGIGVFALKEPLFALAATGDDALTAIVAVSRWVDALGLFTFEQFAQAREQVITDQAEQLLELSTPVVKLWDGRPRRAADRHARLGPHPGRHGEAAAGAGGHRLASTPSSTSPACPPSTPRSRSTC